MSAIDRPDWLPESYDPDAPLRERLPIMADIEGGIEIVVGDDRGTVEHVLSPMYLDEDAHGSLTLKTGPHGRKDIWSWEVVVPAAEDSEPFLRDVDPDQDYEAYVSTRKRWMENIDARIYGIDDDRLDGVDGDSA